MIPFGGAGLCQFATNFWLPLSAPWHHLVPFWVKALEALHHNSLDPFYPLVRSGFHDLLAQYA
jgi:hypothetical protein